MIFKKGVKLAGLRPEIIACAIVIDGIYQRHGRPEGVTVTSVVDGKHSPNSLHYDGYAIDTRTHYFDKGTQKKVAQAIRDALTDEFDVVLERTHIHTEFDPR